MTALRPIDALDHAQVAGARAVYEEAFVEPLRVPFTDLVDHRPDERFLVLVDDERPVGIAFVRDLGPTTTSFLRYLAVDHARRGGGLGAHLWRELCTHLADTGRTLLYLDVEDPDEPGIEAAERYVRERRVAFYARHGAIALPVRDYAPPHGTEQPRLLLLASDLRPASSGPLRPGGLETAIRSVYAHRYGMADTDPAIRTTLSNSGLS